MFKPFAIIPIVTAVVLAQAPSSLIPTGISDGCNSYLKDLNTNTDFKGCTSAVSGAASAFSGLKNPTAAQVTSALGTLCATSVDTACPDDLVGSIIAKFYTACTAELTSNPNKGVVQIYDNLFVLEPFRKAVCALDDGGNYCSAQAKLPASVKAADLQQVLSMPSSSNSAALVPNATAVRDTNLPFLFLDPSLPASSLCNVCTRKIINAYVNFEGTVQYAPGLGQSLYLSTQTSLYAGIKEKCGASFLQDTGVVKAAGGLAGGTLGGTNGAVQLNGGVVATSMSVLALLVSSVL